MMRVLIIFAVLGLALANVDNHEIIKRKISNKNDLTKHGSNKKRTLEHEFCETGVLDDELVITTVCYWSGSAETAATYCDPSEGWWKDDSEDDVFNGEEHLCYKEFPADAVPNGNCNELPNNPPGISLTTVDQTCSDWAFNYYFEGDYLCSYLVTDVNVCCQGGKSECPWNDKNYYYSGYDYNYYSKQDNDEFWNNCQKGMYNANGKCNLCPSGTYSDGNGGKCNICPEGTYSPAMSSECYPCPPGTYSVTKGSNTCHMCPANTHSNYEGTQCIQCPPGNMAAPGSPQCKPCGGGGGSYV